MSRATTKSDMKRDDIIELAKKCGLLIDSNDCMSSSNETSFWVGECYFDIERFVALVALAENQSSPQ